MSLKDDLLNNQVPMLRLIALGLVDYSIDSNTNWPKKHDLLQLKVNGGYLSISKTPKLVQLINRLLDELPQIKKVFLDYAHEIIPSLYADNNIQILENINAQHITIAIGDLAVKQNFVYATDRIKFIGKDHFQWRHWKILTHWHRDYFKNELTYVRDFNHICSKKYTNIIGIYKSHRIYIASELHRNGYSHHGLTNCTPQTNHLDTGKTITTENESKRNYFYCDNIEDRFAELQPTFQVSDLNKLNKMSAYDVNSSPLNWFADSYFYISNETCFSNNWPYSELFITEKTFKPIVHQMPFIIAGSAGTLKYLRSVGYETFPELFDESYDEEVDSNKRIQMIIKQIQRACNDPHIHKKIYNMQDKLRHNRNIFFSQ